MNPTLNIPSATHGGDNFHIEWGCVADVAKAPRQIGCGANLERPVKVARLGNIDGVAGGVHVVAPIFSIAACRHNSNETCPLVADSNKRAVSASGKRAPLRYL